VQSGRGAGISPRTIGSQPIGSHAKHWRPLWLTSTQATLHTHNHHPNVKMPETPTLHSRNKRRYLIAVIYIHMMAPFSQ
jgi:hypothetical protein